MTPDGPGGARLLSLDVFRGAAVAAMILVNAPGPAATYPLMRHTPWEGWTPTDLIFPAFLFIVGTAIPFAFGKRLERGEARGALAWRAVKHAAVLVAIGLPFGLPVSPEAAFRVPGVLQRIGACYLAAAISYLALRTRAVAAAAVSLLAAYWLLMTVVPVPGGRAGDLSPAGNLASFVDREVLGAHMANPVYDAEGLLSTIPAAATALFGVVAGIWLRGKRGQGEKAAGLAAAGAGAVLLGLWWGLWFPFNKHLYTSSFAVFACGAASVLLACLYWLVDARGRRAWARPFELLGAHALFAFCGSSLGEALLDWGKLSMPDGTPGILRLALIARLFGGLSPENASLAWAACWTLLWLGAVKCASAARARRTLRPIRV